MKSILRFGLAAVLALTTATQVWAALADQIYFSTSPTLPFENATFSGSIYNTTKTVTSLNPVTLYLWVTSSNEAATAITPADTVPGGTGTSRGAAAIALNLTRSAGTGSATSAQYYNWNGIVGDPSQALYAYTNGGTPLSRWTETQSSIISNGAGGFTNFQAATSIQNPQGPFFPAGSVTGLSSLSNGDPKRVGAAVPNGGLQFAWNIGQVTFTPTAGANTFSLGAGTQQITKGGNNPPVDIDLSPLYNYGTLTITANAGIFGDLNTDGKVNDLDLGILLGNWQQNVAPSGGELNNNPPVNDLDLGLLLGAWAPGAGSVAAVPEPSTFVLLGLGAVGLAWRVRRKTQK